MPLSSSDQILFKDVLKRVSRSFYLTLAILPHPVRSQIGLAYLLARAADTIADAGKIDDAVRMECLGHLKRQLWESLPDWEQIRKIQERVIPRQSNRDERRLLEELEKCFRIFYGLHPTDRSHVARVLSVLIGGMEFDIRQFPRTNQQTVHALQAIHDLEYYTYGRMCGRILDQDDVHTCTRLSALGSEFDDSSGHPVWKRLTDGQHSSGFAKRPAEWTVLYSGGVIEPGATSPPSAVG